MPSFSPFIQGVITLVWRDLLMMARRKRTYFMRTLFAGGIVLVAYLAWIESRSGEYAMVINRELRGEFEQRLEWIGRRLFEMVAITGALLAALIAPVFTAGTVSQEKERGTIGVLQVSQLGGRQIVVAKALSSLFSLFVLIAAGLPVAASAMLFGGVGPSHLIALSLALFSLAAFCASIGFFCSVISYSVQEALVRAYLLLIAYGAVMPIFCAILAHNEAEELLQIIHPGGGIIYITGVAKGWKSDWGPAVGSILFNTLFASLFFVVSVGLFPRFADQKPSQVWRRLFEWIDDFFERANRGRWSVRFKSDRLEGNPVSWKERHFRVLGKTDHMIRAGYGMAWMLILFYLVVSLTKPRALHQHGFHMVMMMLLTSLWYFVLAAFAASSISSEKDRNSWEVLLTTSLTRWMIISGKLRGTIRASIVFMVFPFLQSLLAAGSIMHARHSGTFQSMMSILAFVCGGLFILGLGTYFSFRCRSTAQAMIWTVGIGVLVNLAPVAFAFITSDKASWLSPVMATASWFSRSRSHEIPAVCSMLLSAFCGCCLLGWTYWRFYKLTGRTPDRMWAWET
ncbi:MAG: ABC transporter permease subunit [Planctomycetota bacterium]|jgi:ABC-type transport system involved in multi-copper enzyme maturation permease subunit|nr:ABC transporter permease subunit [Planctomycetota bacterium]MDP7249114.1 ABC transporter permease subunit [Planctomycetota bacterium]